MNHYTMSPDSPSFAVPDDDTESLPPSLKEAVDYAIAKLRDPEATTRMRLVASSDLSEAYWAHVEPPSQPEPCCGEYASCSKPCTPRGRWQAEQAPPRQPDLVQVRVRGKHPSKWAEPDTTERHPTPLLRAEYLLRAHPGVYEVRKLYTEAPPPRQPLTGGKTTFAQRFTDAVAILCGSEPPAEFVNEWLINAEVNGVHRLQEWVCTQDATPQWAQGIVVLDAAHVLATSPEEGEQHEAKNGITKEQA